MSTKIFGDIETGNHIEIKTKISFLGKRRFTNATKAAVSMTDGGVGFKVVSIDQDADIVLLRNALISITNNRITKNTGITLQDIDDSFDNLQNFEQAIEFLKRENKLGEYDKLGDLSKQELEIRRDNLYSNIEFIENLIETKGN